MMCIIRQSCCSCGCCHASCLQRPRGWHLMRGRLVTIRRDCATELMPNSALHTLHLEPA
jgi:hypothetical protein